MLNDLNIKFKYDSDKDDLINEFYMPVLSNSSEYYRMSGFFSSTSLAISAQGISNFIINDGKMKLICSAVLSKEDKRIIEESNENPTKFIEKYALNDFRSMNEGFVKEHVEALGWMRDGCLQMTFWKLKLQSLKIIKEFFILKLEY